METRSQQDEERANLLEQQVQQAKVIAEEADRKHEEVRRPTITVFFTVVAVGGWFHRGWSAGGSLIG